MNFGTFYGLFPRGLQRTLKFKAGLEKTEDQCARIIANLKTGYPRLSEWQEETVRAARINGYSDVIFPISITAPTGASGVLPNAAA